MKWTTFDADDENNEFVEIITKLGLKKLERLNVENDKQNKDEFINRALKGYKEGFHCELNEIISFYIFKPHEFDSNTLFDQSLDVLAKSFLAVNCDWREGSKKIQCHINNLFPEAGDRALRGGRECVILDTFIIVKGNNVAIEYETSTNIDNGYFSLREAIKSKKADFGVMIVPWSASSSGRANEAIGTGRLDREYDGIEQPIGPVYSISLVRWIDVYRQLLKI